MAVAKCSRLAEHHSWRRESRESNNFNQSYKELREREEKEEEKRTITALPFLSFS